MSLLCDKDWKLKYTPDDGDLVRRFYAPAVECAVRYDRLTGYFQARTLTLAARGIEGLVRNNGRMRLLVGCTLAPPEVEAIAKGAECRVQLRSGVAGRQPRTTSSAAASHHQLGGSLAPPARRRPRTTGSAATSHHQKRTVHGKPPRLAPKLPLTGLDLVPHRTEG